MTTEEKYNQRLQWFKDRIGKRVFRPMTTCRCKTCEDAYLNGVEISDDGHAKYLMDIEGAYGQETRGGFQYFDTREEMLALEALSILGLEI